LPPRARYFLVTPNYRKKIRKIPQLAHARPVVWTPKYPPTFRGGESVLFVMNEQQHDSSNQSHLRIAPEAKFANLKRKS
jgi:hypothetical protein